MSFTITRTLAPPPSYSALGKLAEKKNILVTGNERTGHFSGRGIEGDYDFGEAGLRGKFTGHGVTGEFYFAQGQVALTVTDKPFWLPEKLLNQKLTEGLAAFCDELG